MEIFRGKSFEKSFSQEIPLKIPRKEIVRKIDPTNILCFLLKRKRRTRYAIQEVENEEEYKVNVEESYGQQFKKIFLLAQHLSECAQNKRLGGTQFRYQKIAMYI
jgi:hypothetical protein